MVRKISISDLSVSHSEEFTGNPLPFRIKIETAKLLSSLGVSVIECSPILDGNTDYLLVKSLASAVSGSCLAVPVCIDDPSSPARTWEALKEAEKPRLQVRVPVSTVQMEYFCHKKADTVLSLISETVSACSALCSEVEFVAEDFGRSEPDFLKKAVNAAVGAGASVVTVADAAGNLLPDEFAEAVKSVRALVPEGVRLGVHCSNELRLADACAVAAVREGADEIKTMAFGHSTVSLKRFPRILDAKSDVIGAGTGIHLTELDKVVEEIKVICEISKKKTAVAGAGHSAQVPASFVEEEQVPPTYKLESFVINTGNVITPTCQIKIRKGDEILENVSVGDGPVDAAFLAIEKVVGIHYELDDFLIRSLTEGREALGETLVKLRHNGKVYSGLGRSKDIVGSSVMAYLNAINKISYEEEKA